jgi:hypothetical protein
LCQIWIQGTQNVIDPSDPEQWISNLYKNGNWNDLIKKKKENVGRLKGTVTGMEDLESGQEHRMG